MKMDMCSGDIVCHPLGSSSRCGFRGQFSSSTCHGDRSSFSMPSIIVSSLEWKVCILFSSLWQCSSKAVHLAIEACRESLRTSVRKESLSLAQYSDVFTHLNTY